MEKELKFEDKMNKLQDIVSQLEKDNTNLDKSIELYSDGLKLAQELKNELETFEKKIDEINGK